MIKLYIFDSVSDARAFERVAEPKPAATAVPEIQTGIDARTTDQLADVPRKKYKKRKLKKDGKVTGKKGTGKGHGVMHCKICGEPGRSDTHPNHGKKTSQAADPAPSGNEMNPDELREAIHGLQQDGLDSLRIAQKLKISLYKVNKYWDAELAASQKGEEQEVE
jgi:hypothetical protein